MEGVVHDGWLVKSPPEKRIVKPKWHRRWFVLKHSGLLPGQFILEYFTDNSCRKLKGKIDLDQCEQIDAGLPVGSKIAGYQHMFDIRTPKRTYYLLAETEAEMNKWVECICSVCGLKIHADEDFLVPRDQSSTVITASNITTLKNVTNPYIPISECHTGKPVINGNFSSLDIIVPLNLNQSSCSENSPKDGFTDLPKDPPPPPPPKSEWQNLSNPISDEFYDHPRPQTHSTLDTSLLSSDLESDETYKVPGSLRPDLAASPISDVFSTLPPRVNWKTYPDDAFLPNSSTVPRRKSSASSDVMKNVYDVVPSYHGSIKEIKPQQKKVQSLASRFENMTVQAPSETERCRENAAEYINQPSTTAEYMNNPMGAEYINNPMSAEYINQHSSAEYINTPSSAEYTNQTAEYINQPSSAEYINQPSSAEYVNQSSMGSDSCSVPPRPPKPSKMRDRHRYENFELPPMHRDEDMLNCNIPPPKLNTPSKQSVSKPEEGEDTHVEFASKGQLSMDDMYDFPKPRTEDNINVLVPAPSNTGTTGKRRHAYSNAAPGLFNNEKLIFTYEYRPSLMTSDGYTSSDVRSVQSSSDAATPPSPSAIGAYANIPSSPTLAPTFQDEFPPVVNRELKPKRVAGSDDKGSFSFLTLQPPPVCRSRMKANKRSFRKPSPTSMSSSNGMPPVPNRFRHLPEMTVTSEDEALNSSGSRRNSSNDEQVRHFFSPLSAKRDEIQYLDLDLDSEPSPSPKTPDRLSASTVYKKVDFVKTKAFNEMRQNVEESYRKSQ
ncbi:hypothetical protein JTE90_006563 [Oedothorax gibbosus]|uniref:PH domain-containing protein n=1 Tax=Oedothorax gibbosus TaxID=931172 RepID=A0AAV6VLP7_9ARAC|nr:hypothetical protein JTE90_006563 [Oedothorax gibbosus]